MTNIDETEGDYTKWNKPDWERQILYITYMWNHILKVKLKEIEINMVASRG